MFPNGLIVSYTVFCVFTDRLALIRQQREEAAKKREEEKAGIKTSETLCCVAFVSQTESFLHFFDPVICFGLLQQEMLRKLKGANKK